jgi:hypothetical protein
MIDLIASGFFSRGDGKFSSDRSVREYLDDIWRAESVPVRLISQDDVAGTLMQ